MRRTLFKPRFAWLTLALLLCTGVAAFAQGGTTSSLSGVVTDTSGAVIPGADVVAKNNATAAESPTVTDRQGRFTIPALNPGTYTVTVTLSGFKTVVLPDVKLLTATPASVSVKLEIGALEETVIVTGATEILQTQTAAVQSTIAVQQISALPLVTRTALDYVVALPGAQTVGSDTRGTTINGLPTVSINITLDGVNVQDNNNRSTDGFFMYIRPLMDSVEEITVSTSTPGAESAGQGAAQIRMTTRAGSNRFSGSVYDTWRNQAGVSEDDVDARTKKRGWLWRLNTPYYFNKNRAKTPAGDYFIDDVRLETPGFRVGGPVMRDKLFYFFNWEWFKWPNQIARTRYLMNEDARQGLFSYEANDGSTRRVNLFEIAAKNGQLTSLDPTIARVVSEIRSAAAGLSVGGRIAAQDLNTDRFEYSPGGEQFRHFPTVRMDYNLSQNHRLTGTFRWNRFESEPDILNSNEPNFPGFVNQAGQWSNRYTWSGTLRSTFGKNFVNEARYGFAGGTTQFYTNVTRSQFDCTGIGCQGGFNLDFSDRIGQGGNDLTTATTVTSPSTRYVPDTNIDNTLTWLKGRHTLSMGGNFTRIKFENWDVPGGWVPGIGFGTNSNDPAYGMLGESSGNYPGGISSAQAGYARQLYAILTGRVTSVSGTYVLTDNGEYEFLSDRWQKGIMDEFGFFLSDSWKMRPNFTLTAGLRYEIQTPFKPASASFTRLEDWSQVYGITGVGNLFKPGTMTGSAPVYVKYNQGDNAYNTDWNNLAPSVGFTWRPNIGENFLSTILSQEPVLRGGYSISYDRYGTGDFTGIFGNNSGPTRAGTRNLTLSGENNLNADGRGLPVLFRDGSRLAPPPTPTLSFPFTPATNESVNTFDPNLRVPYTHQYSFGWQRQLGKNMALEVRYIGNTNVGGWNSVNLNDSDNWNIMENGFYDEFRVAQRNLQANIAAGRGNTFAYTGAPGTAPLPIFLAHFAGIPLGDARNQNTALYTSSNFRSSNWYNALAYYNPNITGVAGTGTSGLQNPSFMANATAAGLPANFWQANPAVYAAGTGTRLRRNGGNTRYDAVQLELRRRLSQGLLVEGSYSYGKRDTWAQPSLRDGFISVPSTQGTDQVFKANWVYQLPFGNGRRFGGNAGRFLNAVIGEWEFSGQTRVQSGAKIDFSGYRLVGMDEKEFQSMFKIYREFDAAQGFDRIYMLPKEVIENSRIAIGQVSAISPTGFTGAPPTGKYIARASSPDCVGYLDGQCAPLSLIVTGPKYVKTDFTFTKRFRLGGRRFVEARMDLYNVFDNINFTPVDEGDSGLSSWEVTGAARDLNASQDAGGRITSFGLRFSW